MPIRRWLTLALRWAALVGMTVWLGGFTFYSAFVLPVLHEELGGIDAGHITGQVSNPLNAVGAATVLGWWWIAFLERGVPGFWARRFRWACLALTTTILAVLIALHPALDERLEAGPGPDFYRLHQFYLVASTFQWGVNLTLLAVTVWLWRGIDESDRAGVEAC